MIETGRCIINGTDISTLGMFIERNGSNDFLSFPDRRTPDYNDWAEHDGLDVDLTDLSFDAKKVTVNYVLIAQDETLFKQCLNSFETLHKTSDYLSIYVAEFNKAFQLRLTGFSKYDQKSGFTTPGKKTAKISVDYMMDDPLQVYTTAVSVPISSRVMSTHVKINSYDLSRFGIVVREVYSSAMIPRSGKAVLERKFDNLSGLIADTEEPKTKPRQVEIQCTMLANTLAELMTNMSALWANMNTISPVRLHVFDEGMQCYYTKMSRFEKDASFRRKITVSFNLHLQEFSEIELVRLLAAQDNRLISTESEILIDLNY